MTLRVLSAARAFICGVAVLSACVPLHLFGGVDNDGVNRDDPKFVTASLLVMSPGNELFSCVGHAAIRLECPHFKLDYCFSYESERAVDRLGMFFAGKLKMGLFSIKTEECLQEYRKDGRGIRQYTLNLPPKVKQRLWQHMDELAAQGANLPYDYMKRGCAKSVLDCIKAAFEPQKVQGPLLTITQRETFNRELAETHPWNLFFLNAIVGTETDTFTEVVTPKNLLDYLRAAKVEGAPLLTDPGRELLPQKLTFEKLPVTPLLAAWLVFGLVVFVCMWMRWSIGMLLVIQALIGCFLLYLVTSSNLPNSGWNWLLVPFNPIMPVIMGVLLWTQGGSSRWGGRSIFVGWTFVLVLLGWGAFMFLSPHAKTDLAYLVLAGIVALVNAAVCCICHITRYVKAHPRTHKFAPAKPVKPIEEPIEEPVEEPVEVVPVEEPVEEPVEVVPVEEPIKVPVEVVPVEEPIEEPIEEPVAEPIEEPIETVCEDAPAEELSEKANAPRVKVLSTSDRVDVITCGLLMLVITGVAWAFPFSQLHPSAWADYAAGTGLRPLEAAFPALWTLLARALTDAFGPTRAAEILPMIGRSLLGVVAALVGRAMLLQLASMSPASRRPLRQLTLLRVVACVTTIGFVTSNPVWTAAQAFTPGFLTFFLFLVSLCAFQSFYFFGSRSAAVICATSLALTFVETPVAIVPWLFMAFLVKRRWIRNLDGDAFRKWVTVIRWPAFFLAVVLAGLVIRAIIVCYDEGWTAAGEAPEVQQLIEATVVYWLLGVVRTARFDGWMLLLVLTIGPMIALASVFRKACDEESSFTFLGLVLHVVYTVFGFLQFFAFGRFGVFDFFPMRMFPGEMARLPALLAFAFCLALSSSVLVTEMFTRRIVWLHDKVSDAIQAVVQSASERFHIRGRRWATVALVLFVLSMLAMPAFDSRNRALNDLRDFLAAVVDDAAGCTEICTDGRLDDGYRLEAARRGVTLRPRPMITRGSKLQGLMQRTCLTNEELRIASKEGPAACLRAMIKDHPQLLDAVAVQMGFEVWKMDLKPLPPMWGTLARFSGTPAARTNSVEKARILSRRFTEASSSSVQADTPLSEYVDAVRWRLSRMAKSRAEAADRVADGKTSDYERKLMRELDAVNITLGDLMSDMARNRRQQGRALSPREVLHLALMRGDCAACGTLAAAVLKTDPENGEAHFAMALSCASDDDFRGAENHFRFCLKLRPNDPAIRNNLALTLHNLGRYAEAREQAERALDLAPHVDEIRDTLARIREAEAIVATNGVPLKIRLVLVNGAPR